jgi:hypothetical protein
MDVIRMIYINFHEFLCRVTPKMIKNGNDLSKLQLSINLSYILCEISLLDIFILKN